MLPTKKQFENNLFDKNQVSSMDFLLEMNMANFIVSEIKNDIDSIYVEIQNNQLNITSARGYALIK